MQKLAALQTATKRALYEAILYPGVDNFVKYFRLQNYWTQQAGLFTMSAKKAMLAHPELDYNLQYSHYNGTVRNQLAADQRAAATGDCQTGRALRHYVFFLPGAGTHRRAAGAGH